MLARHERLHPSRRCYNPAVRPTAIKLLGLCFASGAVGCADRQPLAGGEGAVTPDANPPVVDAGADRTSLPDASNVPTFVMIDDMEEHADGVGVPTLSAFIWQSPGTVRIGNWFVSSPDGSTKDVGKPFIEPPRGDSHRAREIRSDTATSADLWAQLDHPQGREVDLSAYAGLVFWARLTGSGGVLDVALDRLSGGGGAFFKSDVTSLPTWELSVSEEWQQFTLRFDDLPTPTTGAVSVDFVVPGTAGPFESMDR